MAHCFSLSFLLLVALVFGADGTSISGKKAVKAGGWTIVDPTTSYFADLSKYAIDQHNTNSSDKLIYSKVLAAKQQVVAGMKYVLIIQDSNGTQYEATIWEKAWEKFRSLQSFNKLQSMPGGFVYRDPTETELQSLGKFAVREYNTKQSSNLQLTYVKLLQARSQVIAGSRNVLILEASQGKSVKQYEASVILRPWEHYQSLESFKPVSS